MPHDSIDLVASLDRLHLAAEACRKKLVEPSPVAAERVTEVAKTAFGWLAVLAVNSGRSDAAGPLFDEWQGGLKVAVTLRSEAGVEVLVAAEDERSAWFRLVYDSDKRSRAVGSYSFAADELETGIGKSYQVDEVLRRIWVEVTKEPPPDTELRERVRARVDGLHRREQRAYYITVPSGLANSPLANEQLRRELSRLLPSLRVITFGHAEQTEGIFVLPEVELRDSIEMFLKMLEETP